MKKSADIRLTINNIPLVNNENGALIDILCGHSSVSKGCLFRPIYSYLPIKDEGEMLQGDSELSMIPEGVYLTGLEVISKGWICPGLTGSIFNLGLILSESYPIETKGQSIESMIYLQFRHIYTNNKIKVE